MAAVKNYVIGKVNEMTGVEGDTSHITLAKGESLVRSYAVFGPGQNPKECAYVAGPLDPLEVEIKVQYCGVCHTDLSMIRNEIGMTSYPFTPGHEVVGIITQVGSRVKSLKEGQRVGAGFFKKSCGECELCTHDRQNLCMNGQPILAQNGAKGGWSESVRVNEDWCVPIPDAIPSEEAAPLMCAGCTVYSPLINWRIGPGSKVGLIGLGGLGHLFIQMSVALGAEVTVFSTSEEKAGDAHKLGAKNFIMEGSQEEKDCQQTLDLIINTAYAALDWTDYLKLLKPGGVLVMVGFPPKKVTIEPFELIYREKKLVGSNVASKKTISEMMDFVVKHGIHPEVELFSIADCGKAIAKFESEGFRYRAVLEVENGFSPHSDRLPVIAKGG